MHHLSNSNNLTAVSTHSANDNFQSHIIDFQSTYGPIEPNLGEAQKFLNVLDPNAKKFSFQTFGDGSDKGPALVRQFHESLAFVKGDLPLRSSAV